MNARELIEAEVGLNEGMSQPDKEIIKNNPFMSLRKPLQDAGFTVDFVTEPMAMYMVQKGRNSRDKVAILSAKNVDGAEFIHNGIAMGDME